MRVPPLLAALPLPETLRGLTLLGVALLLLPLLGAVAYASLKLDQLVRQSQAVVQDTVRATQNSQRVLNLLTQLERDARQYLVLNDRALLGLFEQTRHELDATLADLDTLPQDEQTRTASAALSRQAAALAESLSPADATDQAQPIDNPALSAELTALSSQAGRLSRGLRALMDAELALLESSVRRTRQALVWQSALLVPALGLLVGFLYLRVLKPLRQIDAAISQLGEERFDQPIRIGGPQDLRALGRQLEWLRERLNGLAEEKSRFLRHMSHELKTPLANIREGTELLLDGSVGTLEPMQEEVTRILRDNGLRLQQLIENLLAFSAWQSRNATLEVTEFRLGALLRDVLHRHQLAVTSQQLKLKTVLPNIAIQADYDKLRLVMENLVSNAIKYSPRNGTIHLRAGADQDWLQLDVADDGPGIPEAERQRVFEAFYQGSQRAATHVGGTGIGLSVVMECVLAHGGTVQIVSGEYRGAHFRVRVPLRQAQVQGMAADRIGTGA